MRSAIGSIIEPLAGGAIWPWQRAGRRSPATKAGNSRSHPDRPADAALPAYSVALFALACGLSVANVYLAHPLLDAMARDLAIKPASVGVVVTVTQAGYALGLIFIVPLGDLTDRRRLIVGQMLLSTAA